MYMSLWDSEYSWNFQAEKSNAFSRSVVKGDFWPRGKMLGGSTSLNGMVYFRGFPRDYDTWESMGNTGWGYDSVKETFRKMENNRATNISDFKDTSDKGPVKIDYFYSSDRVRDVFLGAAYENGYRWARDFNGDDRLGYTQAQGTLNLGIRQSTAHAYLITAGKRQNLHVVKFATVTKLIITGDRVVGVNFLKNNAKYRIKATNEVILTAGAVGTTKILLSSGIGPSQHLQEMGVHPIHDLPVGENLQDHVKVSLHFKFEEIDGEISASQALDNIYLYFKNRTGPYGNPVNPDFNAFLNTKSKEATHPNIQVQHVMFERNSPALYENLKVNRYQQKYIDQLMEANRYSTVVQCYIILTNPKSVGKIQLRNRDPLSQPRIYPNYFDKREDLDIVIEGMKIYNKYLESKAFKEKGGKLILFDGLECDGYPSDSFWECYARHFSSTLYHSSGTTKMGPASDPTAVVDPRLKVRHMENLRVCDAGIMPKIVTVNTVGASMMIGERCAEIIKEEYAIN